ncbi:MAG: hypothetical protein HYS55_05415, partial [Candidatus Omnitrophica bacterium]|nr:hypothetical protein [Candidatus Omnitrophota bacterium]
SIELNDLFGIDRTKVTQLALILKGGGTKSLMVNWGLFSFIPQFGPNSSKTPQTMSTLPGAPKNAIFKAAGNGSFVVNSAGDRGFILTYNTEPGGFVAGVFAYDNFGTVQTETFDLSGLTELDFGIRGDVSDIKFEITDVNNQKVTLLLTGVTSTEERIWSIPTSMLNGIDLTQIRFISFVVDGENLQGDVEVNRITAPPVIPVSGPISPAVGLTDSQVTLVPDVPITTAESSITRISNELVELNYDVSGNALHSRLSVRFDDLETPYVIESTDLSFLDRLIFGVSATGTNQVQVEIIDASGAKSVETLVKVSEQEQFYVIDFSKLNTPVDLAHIQVIRFSVNPGIVNAPTGVIQIRLKGLSTIGPDLTTELEAIRRQIIAKQLDYFQIGVGVDPETHLPYDQLNLDGTPRTFTTLTAIGFYLQILGEVVRGSLDNGMTREQALEELGIVLARLAEMQQNNGMGGLLPVVYDMPPVLPEFGPSPTFPFIAFGDNANLSQSIAVLVGTLESIETLSDSQRATAQNIIQAAENFLNNQKTGYEQFYSADTIISVGGESVPSKRFFAAFNTQTEQFEGRLDRLANEFRSGVAFVIARYGFPEDAWNNLIAITKAYQDQFGQSVTNLTPFEGGAFQMFWPLLWSDEQNRESMKAALQNFLYTAFDFSNRNQIPGFVSASAIPEGGYQGKMGIPGAAETSEPLISDVGSIYALASAYVLNPALVVFWLEALFEAYPGLVTSYGFIDSIRSATEHSQVVIAIDQASVILGLLGSGGDFMEAYLKNRSLDSVYQGLYNGLSLGIQAVGYTPAGPPSEFASKGFSVIGNVGLEGTLGSTPCVKTDCADSDVFGTQIRYTNDTSDFGGHFWEFDQAYDARNHELVISYSGALVPASFTLELKNSQDVTVASFPVTTQPEAGLRTLRIDLSGVSGLEDVQFLLLVVNPSATGPNADFFIHQISFRQFPSQIPSLFSVITPTSIEDLGSQDHLNFNVLQLQVTGRLAFASVSTNRDFSTADVVFGFKSNKALRKIKVELEDEAGKKASGFVTGIDTKARYYQFLKEYVPTDIDLSRIRKINILIDETALEEDGATLGDLVVEMGLV